MAWIERMSGECRLDFADLLSTAYFGMSGCLSVRTRCDLGLRDDMLVEGDASPLDAPQ
jgi:hypothetical protein